VFQKEEELCYAKEGEQEYGNGKREG